jgi:hypothetical protein
VHQFELLGSAGSEEGIDTLSDIARIFFSLEKQENIRLEAQALCHRNNGIETWNLLPPLHVTPEIARYVAPFGSFLQAEFCCLSQLSDPLRK